MAPNRARGTLATSFIALFLTLLASSVTLSGCGGPTGDPELTKNVRITLVDWHIVGLWVINCPCCWIRVENFNNVPIKNISFDYRTFDYEGKLLTQGNYTMDKPEDVVAPWNPSITPAPLPKNFIEQYIGLVALESDMLKIELKSVELAGDGHH